MPKPSSMTPSVTSPPAMCAIGIPKMNAVETNENISNRH